jgi:hypothetical protein
MKLLFLMPKELVLNEMSGLSNGSVGMFSAGVLLIGEAMTNNQLCEVNPCSLGL